MIPGDFLVCKKADKRNLLTVGKRYVVKLHWASYVDILLPPTWATFEMKNFYTVEPQGETNIDNERFENLKTLTEVLEHYHQKVYDVSYYKKRQEYSVKRAGEFADKFITDSVEWFDMIRK